MADTSTKRPEEGHEANLHPRQLKLRGATAVIRSLRVLNAPKKHAPKSAKTRFDTQYPGLDTKIVQLCESNVPLRRRLAHLSMIHADEVDGDPEDDLELLGGQGLKDPHEDELLALLRKQDAAVSNAGAASFSHPSIQRSKSAIVLPPAVDQDVAEAVQHDLVTSVPTVQWTAAFEIPYLKFKQKRRRASLSSAQMFRAFLLTPVFRQLHAAANGTIHFDEDTTGEFSSHDVDATQTRGLQKRFQKLAKPIRESLELSLSSHMLDTLEHLTTMYTAARSDFLANMSKYSKFERQQSHLAKHRVAALSDKRDQLRQEVDRTKQHLAALAQRSGNVSPTTANHVITTPRLPDFLKPIVSLKRVTKEHSPAWKHIKDLEQCNTTRSLQASVAYTKAIHTDGIGGGITTAAVLQRQHEAMACYIVYIQRHYRGHLARRFVWALKWMCVMWRYIFLPDDPDHGAGALDRGFLRLDDFEAMFEYFSYQSSPERIYLAGFALTVPPSRLGPQFVEYKRFKRYWHRFMYRPVSTGDRIRFVLFVRNRQTVVAAMDGKSRVDQAGSGTSSSTAIAQWKKYSLLQQAQTPHRKGGGDATVDKYQTHLSALNDETKALGLRARRQLLPKDEQRARGWALVRHVVEANTMRQSSYKSVHHVVSHLQDVDALDGRRRMSTLREDMLACSRTNDGGIVATKSPTKLHGVLQRLIQAVQDARNFVTYIEEIGWEPTALKSTKDELPPPACVARLDKIKHVRGCNKLVDLLDRQHSLNLLFQDSWLAFSTRKTILGPDGRSVVTSTRNYVLESMQLLSLAWRQLRLAATSALTKSGSMRNLHRMKRTEQFHDLLMAYDVNIRNMSVVLEGYADDGVPSPVGDDQGYFRL